MDDAIEHLSKCRTAIFALTGDVDLTDLEDAGARIEKLQEISRMLNRAERKIFDYQEEHD